MKQVAPGIRRCTGTSAHATHTPQAPRSTPPVDRKALSGVATVFRLSRLRAQLESLNGVWVIFRFPQVQVWSQVMVTDLEIVGTQWPNGLNEGACALWYAGESGVVGWGARGRARIGGARWAGGAVLHGGCAWLWQQRQ